MVEYRHRCKEKEYIEEKYNKKKGYKEERRYKSLIDHFDAYRLVLKEFDNIISDFPRFGRTLMEFLEYDYTSYNYIIVDETQDLDRLKLEAIIKLYKIHEKNKNNCLMFLYDVSQSIYDYSWLGNGRTFKSLGLNVAGRIKKLETSYRTSRQIHQAANDLISYYKKYTENEENELKPIFKGTEEGIKPIVFDFYKNKKNNIENSEREKKEKETFLKIIKELVKNSYEYKDIMVIAKTIRDVDAIYTYLCTDNHIPSEKYIRENNRDKNKINFRSNTVKILTIHNAKGLESKAVFILRTGALDIIKDFDEKEDEELKNANILYTAMTRAKELLFISSDAKYIPKIDKKYLSYIDDYENFDINSHLQASIEENKIFIDTNKTDRFENLVEEIKKQREIEQKKKAQEELEIQQKFFNTTIVSEISEEEIRKKFYNVDEDIISLIIEAENLYDFYKKKSIGSSTVYGVYAKILEFMLKKFFNKLDSGYDEGQTLGGTVYHMYKYEKLEQFYNDINKMRIVKNRNNATHSTLDQDSSLEDIREYLITNNNITKLQEAINEQLKIELKEPEKIEKNVYISGENKTVRVNQKEYYSYLLDNDEMAICKDKIPPNTYKIEGHYTSSRGLKIFVIEKY